jgi:hypothetical protein
MQQTHNLKDFYNYEAVAAIGDIEDDVKQSNLEMVDMEIESLTSILNQTEF